MADIYGRMRQVEKRLEFIMTNLRMKAAISTGLVDKDGNPQMRIFEGSLEELFRAAKLADQLIDESDVEPASIGIDPAAAVETVNG